MVRFDDLCPTNCRGVWLEVEALLHEFQVKPILGVVPDNRDPALKVHAADETFWARVRAWQGTHRWSIGLHGYQHLYVNRNRGVLRLGSRSEFAGLPYDCQFQKLESGLAIIAAHGVQADCWVAPSHSFDDATVSALRNLGVKVVSDGLWRFPHCDAGGSVWVPQQLWRFKRRSRGVFTVCLHATAWGARELKEFRASLQQFEPQLTDLPTVLERFGTRKLRYFDKFIAHCDWTLNHYLRPKAARLVSRCNPQSKTSEVALSLNS